MFVESCSILQFITPLKNVIILKQCMWVFVESCSVLQFITPSENVIIAETVHVFVESCGVLQFIAPSENVIITETMPLCFLWGPVVFSSLSLLPGMPSSPKQCLWILVGSWSVFHGSALCFWLWHGLISWLAIWCVELITSNMMCWTDN